jgi:hypothetical protein
MNIRETFFGSVSAGDPKKSLRPSKTATPSFSTHEEVERRRAQRAPRIVELEVPESGPFRSTASLLAKMGAAEGV